MRIVYRTLLLSALAWAGSPAAGVLRAQDTVGAAPVPWSEALTAPVVVSQYDTTQSLESTREPAVCPHDTCPRAWGIVGFRGYVIGEQVAPNGVNFDPFFSLDLNFNLWLCRSHSVYLFNDARFWGQKPGPGITNPTQGPFDFSKRELDFNLGLAWNYWGRWEARFFAYSSNNLNRGDSLSSPFGFNDGVCLENRYYLTAEHDRLGECNYDLPRDSFVSAGFYPSKDMIGLDGELFKPSLFARAYLTHNLFCDWSYLYLDTLFLTEKPMQAKRWDVNVGVAVRPFSSLPHMEFRLASENAYDIPAHEWDTNLSIGVRWTY